MPTSCENKAATSIPCTTRWPNSVVCAYASSTCSGLKSPLRRAKSCTSWDVNVRWISNESPIWSSAKVRSAARGSPVMRQSRSGLVLQDAHDIGQREHRFDLADVEGNAEGFFE